MADLNIELILQSLVAGIPVTLAGTIENGELTQMSGCVTLNERLFSILNSLEKDYGDAREVLKKLTGNVVLEKLGVAYRKDKSV